MKDKTLAIVAYCTIIGWVVAYIKYKETPERSPLVRYHLAQALGVFIAGLAISIVVSIVARIIPTLGFLLSVAGLLPLILLIFGIITASNEAQRPVPVIGKVFENKFSFLN